MKKLPKRLMAKCEIQTVSVCKALNKIKPGINALGIQKHFHSTNGPIEQRIIRKIPKEKYIRD